MAIDQINLNLLRSLQVLLDECHVSRAAEKLNLTQSAVSRQLSQLRELCGDSLLVRDGNQLIPTPKAMAMRGKLALLLGEVDQLLNDKPFDPLLWQQEFVISSSDYVAQYILPNIVALGAEYAPKVNLAYRLWQPDYLSKMNEQGIHLASTMLPEPPKHLSSVQIGEDKSLCLMRKNHPLASIESLSCDQITAYSHLKVTGGGDKDSPADIALNALGYQRRIALKVPFFSAAINALLASDYLMIVPEHIAINLSREYPLTYATLPFDTQAHQYWLMWHPKYDLDSAHQWMRERVLHVMQTCPYSIGMI